MGKKCATLSANSPLLSPFYETLKELHAIVPGHARVREALDRVHGLYSMRCPMYSLIVECTVKTQLLDQSIGIPQNFPSPHNLRLIGVAIPNLRQLRP